MKRPTIKDVAAHAGVSKATVSLVLRDSPQIPSATKARIREAMEAVGYVYNRRAAEMRGLSSKTLGLVVANVRNPYFAELTMAVEERAHESGYTLILGCSADALDRQDAVLRAMAEQQVDGIILLPASHTTPASLTAAFGRRGLPHALVARSVPGYDCDYAGSDNEAGGRVVGQHLRSIGARRVAFLGGVEPSVPRADRMRGLMQGLAPDVVALCADVPTEHDASVGHARLVDRALRDSSLPDAIVAYNDMHAFTIMSALRSRGVEPGRDVSVASFDNVPEAAQQYPSLTTADGFPTRVGIAATEMVLDRIAGGSSPSIRHTLIQPELRIRQSTTLSELAAVLPTA